MTCLPGLMICDRMSRLYYILGEYSLDNVSANVFSISATCFTVKSMGSYQPDISDAQCQVRVLCFASPFIFYYTHIYKSPQISGLLVDLLSSHYRAQMENVTSNARLIKAVIRILQNRRP